jgi:hypothetical protein
VIKLTIFGCEFLRGHYKCFQCLSQLVGVVAHLKHSAQPPTIIYNDPVHISTCLKIASVDNN